MSEIDRSIITTYRKSIWKKFCEAINRYDLVRDKDKIAVCISGGKDSFLMAKCFIELKSHKKIDFDLEFIAMNPGYSPSNLAKLKDLAKELEIDLKIYDSDIFEVANKLDSRKPCYMCARMRRGFLYSKARELGCNKIALGHHLNDVVETTLLSIIYNGEFKTMMPRLASTNYTGLVLIRPLYLIEEASIIRWAKHNNLEFLSCSCPYEEKGNIGKRLEVKKIIAHLKTTNPHIDTNILRSLEKVNLDTIISYKYKDKVYSILDEF